MSTRQFQMPVAHKGKKYSGIYSVSGDLMIARIPGVGSKSGGVGAEPESTARTLLEEILASAEKTGMLDR